MWEVKERKTKIMATNLLYENKGMHGGDFFFFLMENKIKTLRDRKMAGDKELKIAL